MIKFKTGNILNSETEAIVNTVNLEGVMGKGIALEFKEIFPDNYKVYKEACKEGKLEIGKMLVTSTNLLKNPNFIINFPTKKHWRYPSKIEYIKSGLEDLKKVILKNDIKSISIPPLGCGNGKLNWYDVKPLIISTLNDLENIEINVYEPSDKAYSEIVKLKPAKEIGLTPERAMILTSFEKYNILGYDLSLLEAQKITYFIQRFGEDLKLKYDKNQYGPYTKNLDYLLNYLDGHYIFGIKHRDVKPFDLIHLNQNKLNEIHQFVIDNCTIFQKEVLERLYEFIRGFESPLGMELLSTVDYIINEKRNVGFETQLISNEIENWSEDKDWNNRKKNLLNPQFIDIAVFRLRQYKDYLYK